MNGYVLIPRIYYLGPGAKVTIKIPRPTPTPEAQA